ncbi:hypothetical protein [uncultured Jannaschia sp.]|uniref:hypothetical protein n=1 Tax=uncultured Jannaschia sp. TaxID=293347 RepID=UPI00261827C8|nr:hypothetical protein [uncultured Jannaschia sp.]
MAETIHWIVSGTPFTLDHEARLDRVRRANGPLDRLLILLTAAGLLAAPPARRYRHPASWMRLHEGEELLARQFLAELDFALAYAP